MEHPPNSENVRSSKLLNEGGPQGSAGDPFLEFHFLTLFPEFFAKSLDFSLLSKAQKKGLVSFNAIQIRNFALDPHRAVDDSPYGGGEGMVLKPDVLYRAWESVSSMAPKTQTPQLPKKEATILLSPQGAVFNQEMARELAGYSKLILVCGHYEGVDERFIDLCVDREVSIGDYVLTGGEIPALVLADAITRLLPGVVGNERSLTEETLENGLLKYPQYTRPREFQGLAVPEILLQGDHGAIQAWRDGQSRERTRRKRPDLLRASS